MKKSVISAAIALAASSYGISAGATDVLARFQGGIGVIPVSNVTVTGATAADQVVTVSPNTVRGVAPAGQIWVIEKLDAKVRTDGRITVKGKGLILGGGNSTGRATGQRVIATLICEAAAPFVQRSTTAAGVPLADNGDFRIDDMLSSVPRECASPMLLIRNAANLGWFAAGILSTDDD
jgi:hypothetical protein